MRLLGPWLLLLLEYLAFSDSKDWKVEHPKTLYAWEGACVWIPCRYTIPKTGATLKNFTVYHNDVYDNTIKNFRGTILYNITKFGEFPSQQERVQFLGDSTNNCTLRIHPVHVEDSGQLGLRMMTEKDKWMEHIGLNVSKTPLPPHIQLPPEIQELKEVALTCLLNFACFGYDIQLQWSLEDLTSTSFSIVNSTTCSVETVLTRSDLTFQPQWTLHGRNLTCQARHSGQVLSEAMVRLDVKHLPKLKIEVSPEKATVKEQESVTMTCQVTSSNPQYKTISWLKDGLPLSEQEGLTLTLPSVTKDMSGKYCCQVSNDMGPGRSEEVTLNVLYAPEPSKVQIHHSPAKEGTAVELVCTSLANPPPTNYTWYHNTKELLGRTEEKFHIPQVFPWHAGNYSCVAENSLGSGQIGQEAELHVHYAPKGVTTVIQNPAPIKEGDSVILSCSYNSSNPRVTRYEWKLRGSWTEPSPGLLAIQKVAWDTPPIACAACHQWCSWAPSVNLNVQYAPRDVKVLWISPQSEIHAGHQVQLRCSFSKSRPEGVRFLWKKNGSLLEEGRDLSFQSVSPEDAGNYSCLVSNSVGQTVSKAWKLQVLYAPRRLRVSITPGDNVMEGRKAALTCESDANPPVSQYAWFDWNNQDLQYAGQTLRLEPTKVQHSGAYRCQGSNRLGKGESPPRTLTIYYSPETIGRRAAMGIGVCLAIVILAIWGVKLRQKWKRIRSRQGPQEHSSGQSFFVRNKKVRRAPLVEGSPSLGCYNPVMEDGVNYATLRFPESDSPRTGDTGTSETQEPLPNSEDTVTYSVVQKRHMGDYENVTLNFPEDEGIHYSELVQFGAGERPRAQEDVEYVTLKR